MHILPPSTLLSIGALALLIAVAALCWYLVRQSSVTDPRARRGHCRRCGYNLRGRPGRCPECGAINLPPMGGFDRIGSAWRVHSVPAVHVLPRMPETGEHELTALRTPDAAQAVIIAQRLARAGVIARVVHEPAWPHVLAESRILVWSGDRETVQAMIEAFERGLPPGPEPAIRLGS